MNNKFSSIQSSTKNLAAKATDKTAESQIHGQSDMHAAEGEPEIQASLPKNQQARSYAQILACTEN